MDAKEVMILITGAHKSYALHMVSRIEFKASKATLLYYNYWYDYTAVVEHS